MFRVVCVYGVLYRCQFYITLLFWQKLIFQLEMHEAVVIILCSLFNIFETGDVLGRQQSTLTSR